ncbi:TLG2-vesicle protein of 38 kDa [Didymella exigua CBS 183.55]|uniref:Golgi apparatus membrane protein TVP38 n=1 Tax=Didymella exigua CBS 183.55 TaxID=1150837 RepID=A0A6A5RVD8_9PLEO|nr:TLG2-vesicle protein of 38 kDa [Didymella exigua CBS 183.55]KAF1932435.1 TLG2-vesicle protein of 38 kDa [Didymella exigua CBS 183.55]
MPASDYDGRALALPLEDDTTGETPIWSRRSQSFARSSHSSRPPTLLQRGLSTAQTVQRRATAQYNQLSPVQKLLFGAGGIVVLVVGILFLVFNERIFGALLPYAKKWRDVTAGWLVLWALIFTVSFPPLIGYSSLLTVAGFVYGFPNGWFIAASATVAGSTASFLLSRTLLRKMVTRLIENDKRFAALALTLKHDGLKLLVMIRMCPLPYSLSNGAVATFPTVHWASFALATAIVSPKLMLHIFIGSQLEKIAESGGKMDARTKAISYLSIAIGAVAGVATGWFMYKKTKERGAELEEEERQGVRRASIEGLANEYADEPDALEAAVHLREEDDDISLRGGWDDEYTDDVTDAAEIGDDDPFRDGDAADAEDGRGRKP